MWHSTPMLQKKHTYLDYAATTPTDSRVLRSIRKAEKVFGNPSSIHTQGLEAKKVLENSRETIARLAQVKKEEIVFTSGGTESNNLVIQGVVSAYEGEGIPHIVTTTIEHPAVFEVCKQLEKSGRAEVTYVEVNEKGIVSPEDIRKAFRSNTVLVTVIHTNNEIGTLQPVPAISRLVKEWRKEQKTEYPYVHTDASQSPCYHSFHREKLGVDMITLDGLKVYGPKGIGLLIKKESVVLDPIIYGGGQEKGLRSGTENLPGIVGLAEALSIAHEGREKEVTRLEKIRDYIINTVLEEFSGSSLNGSLKNRVANNINICFENTDAEFLVILLDQRGFSVSFSSSCRTKAENATSYVVEALGKESCAGSSIRITLGRYTAEKDAQKLIQALKVCVPKAKA